MSQAIVNPEELRRFAARLKQFNNEMIGQLTTLARATRGSQPDLARPGAR